MMADNVRIRLTIQLISEITQKHLEQIELIAEARRMLEKARPDTFLGRRLRSPDLAMAETSASSIPPSGAVDSGPAEI
jgi:hypothetical protein